MFIETHNHVGLLKRVYSRFHGWLSPVFAGLPVIASEAKQSRARDCHNLKEIAAPFGLAMTHGFSRRVRFNAPQEIATGKALAMTHGFSLAELLITLIIVSCILAAFAPVITKRMAQSSVSIGGASADIGSLLSTECNEISESCSLCYSKKCIACSAACSAGLKKYTETCVCLDCESYDPNCADCDPKNCTLCASGYYLDSDKSCKTCASNLLGCTTCKNKTTCSSCESGYYLENGNCNSCSAVLEACVACSSSSVCTQCRAGYSLKNGKCYYSLDYSLRFNGLYITKFNAGDSYAPAIPDTVTVVKSGESCTDSKCCWQFDESTNKLTSASGCTISQGTSTYSGCSRTVCNWEAANAICNNIEDTTGAKNWRLATSAEMNNWVTFADIITVAQGSSGLQLCDYSSAGSNSVYCPKTSGNGFCVNNASNSGDCFPSHVWSASTSSANAYYYILSGGAISSALGSKIYAMSTRCVRPDSAIPNNCLIADKNGVCTRCAQGYYINSSGTCSSCTSLTGCKYCSSSSVCSECDTGYYINGNSCSLCTSITGCSTCNSQTGACTACINNSYFLQSGVCRPCSNIANCLECSASNYCTKCTSAYNAVSGTCVVNDVNCKTYNSSGICTACNNGYYLSSGKCIACNTLNSRCTACSDAYTCTACSGGYTPSGTSCLISPAATISYGGKYIMKFNAGDDNVINQQYLSNLGIYIVTAGSGTSCASAENHPCCWVGGTRNQTNCNSANSANYSGCNRTVCDWWAGVKICESFGWKLPLSSQLQSWRTTAGSNSALQNTLKATGATSLQLCDYSQGYSAPWCEYGASRCPGSANGGLPPALRLVRYCC